MRVPDAWKNPLAISGTVIVVLWLLVTVFAPWLAPFDPLAQESARLLAPNGTNWFGTDALGRDVFSRVIAGTRTSIPVAMILVVISLLFGTVLGAVAGFLGTAVDEVIMRVTDVVLAFPSIILAMVIAAALGPSLMNAVIALLLVSWPQYTRISRSLVISLRSSEFVIAGRLMGSGVFTSLRRDIAPNVASPMLVLAAADFGSAILLLSGLSFLGLGAVPPAPEWGSMVSDGTSNFSAWWIAAFPGLAIFTIVVGVNFMGDAMRDALDPRSNGRLS
ncbi:ABC transporter permease [Cryobacterium melibiosiphilum]|uniref:ABC transporter permease n=2 Tax=Cryobacterium melibiosiphilum TaxID=995039 RepID=A0A3A5MWN4_9MICO|nr:ABC transporter permease [Cryobacterium melibiosiphilum]